MSSSGEQDYGHYTSQNKQDMYCDILHKEMSSSGEQDYGYYTSQNKQDVYCDILHKEMSSSGEQDYGHYTSQNKQDMYCGTAISWSLTTECTETSLKVEIKAEENKLEAT